jgi:hypothetical protein
MIATASGRREGGMVMVGNDQIDADRARMGGFAHIADAAIDGDQQANPFTGKRIDGLDIQAIPLTDAVWNIGQNQPAHGADRLHQQRHCGHAIGIVIAVHRHQLVIVNGCGDTLHRGLHPAHAERIVQAIVGAEELAHRSIAAHPALIQQRRDQRRQCATGGDELRRRFENVPAFVACGQSRCGHTGVLSENV